MTTVSQFENQLISPIQTHKLSILRGAKEKLYDIGYC